MRRRDKVVKTDISHLTLDTYMSASLEINPESPARRRLLLRKSISKSFLIDEARGSPVSPANTAGGVLCGLGCHFPDIFPAESAGHGPHRRIPEDY